MRKAFTGIEIILATVILSEVFGILCYYDVICGGK